MLCMSRAATVPGTKEIKDRCKGQLEVPSFIVYAEDI